MVICLFFMIFAALILILLFIPDLFPRCSCCGRYKFRILIRIHKAVSLNPGYGGSRSVCTGCCRKYDITDLKDLDRVMTVKRKVKLESL